MKKVVSLVFVSLLFGCAPMTVEQSLKKLTYQKDPLSASEYWVSWRTPTFEFLDPFLEEYEIGSYLKCVKTGDNYSVAMTTQSGADPIFEKYEISAKNGTPIYLGLGKHIERKATVYKGQDAHIDLYETEFSPEEVKTLTEIVKTKGMTIRPISVNGGKFLDKKFSQNERTRIEAILKVCKYM